MNLNDIYATEWFASIPALKAGTVSAEFSVDGKSCVIEHENYTVEAAHDYVRELKQNGFEAGEDYLLGENFYALRYGEKATVYVSCKSKSLPSIITFFTRYSPLTSVNMPFSSNCTDDLISV